MELGYAKIEKPEDVLALLRKRYREAREGGFDEVPSVETHRVLKYGFYTRYSWYYHKGEKKPIELIYQDESKKMSIKVFLERIGDSSKGMFLVVDKNTGEPVEAL